MRVKSLEARKIFATNSMPTIEVVLRTENSEVSASVPIGTSRGKREVEYLPAEQALLKFNLIRRHFRTNDFENIKEVDETLRMIDSSPYFRQIGGNVALAISSAFLKAFAAEAGKEVYEFLLKDKKAEMPRPLCNVVGGWGKTSDVQEYLLLPVHQKSFYRSIENISRAYFQIAEALKRYDFAFTYGKNIESAWVTNLSMRKILEILMSVANESLLKMGIDFAASQRWDGQFYKYLNANLRRHDQISFIEQLTRTYPIIYIEDPVHEDDLDSFAVLTHRLQNVIVCGDDLYTTDPDRISLGVSYKATNAAIIKPSQVGTITGAIKAAEEAKANGMKVIMSHRSGETEDNLICHLAIGLGADYVKFGISGERTSKINELLRIEQKIA